MRIVDLAEQPEKIREEAAKFLVEDFDAPYGWPTRALARDEVPRVISEGFARAMTENDFLYGWMGGLPEYNGRVWELHPLVVRRQHRRHGIGRRLVEAFEAEARNRGAFTIPGHIRGLRDRGKVPPVSFLPEARLRRHRHHA